MTKRELFPRILLNTPRASWQPGNGAWWGVRGVLSVARVHDGIIACISPEREHRGGCNMQC